MGRVLLYCKRTIRRMVGFDFYCLEPPNLNLKVSEPYEIDHKQKVSTVNKPNILKHEFR